MALARPTYKVSTSASRKTTERKTIFLDIKPDASVRVRVLPPTNASGSIFTKVTNHFKLKNDEGFGIALACLDDHGTDETGTRCFLCDLTKFLRSTGDKSDETIARDIAASPRWYTQVLLYDREAGAYTGPRLLGLSKTAAEALTDILVAQEENEDDFFCDIDGGQDLTIRRSGSGFQTKYTVSPSGVKAKLDDIFPAWEDVIIPDVLGAMELRLEDREGQFRAARRSYPDAIDWDAVREAIDI